MKLTLADIAEARAYERERPALRARIQELRDRRRVHLGPLVSVAFESRETVRYQVQEMVRAERILHDRGVQAELDAYNPLIPGAGRLSATLFIECTRDDQLREWLPKLVGIERHLELRIGDMRVSSIPEAGHAAQLTRPDVTAAVHYLVIDVGVALKGTVAIVSEVSGVSGSQGSQGSPLFPGSPMLSRWDRPGSL